MSAVRSGSASINALSHLIRLFVWKPARKKPRAHPNVFDRRLPVLLSSASLALWIASRRNPVDDDSRREGRDCKSSQRPGSGLPGCLAYSAAKFPTPPPPQFLLPDPQLAWPALPPLLQTPQRRHCRTSRIGRSRQQDFPDEIFPSEAVAGVSGFEGGGKDRERRTGGRKGHLLCGGRGRGH